MTRRPDPPPVPTNDLRVVAAGTALWAAALAAGLLLRADWVWVCVWGFGLGLVGVRYVSRRRSHN